MNDQVIRQILSRLQRLERQAVRLRLGEVTGNDPLDVALGGADTSYSDVAAVAAGGIGETIAALVAGNDLLVLGPVEGAHKIPFPFAAGWGDFAGFEACTYSKVGDLVVLQGLATKTSGTPAANDVIGTLPVGFRPSGLLAFGQDTGDAASARRIDVYATGEVKWTSGGAVASDFTTLSGISFVVD